MNFTLKVWRQANTASTGRLDFIIGVGIALLFAFANPLATPFLK